MIRLLLFLFLFGGFFTLQAQEVVLETVGTYHTGIFDEGAAEIITYDPSSQQIFSSNANSNTVDIISISDPANPTLVSSIDMSPYGGGLTSVTVRDGLVAVASEDTISTNPGTVVFFDMDGDFVNQIMVGVLPDMIIFSPDGTKVLTANEGEPNDDYTIDPEGSISIIDVSNGAENATVMNATFESFNDQIEDLRAEGVRIYGPNATVAQDVEPEFITFSPDGATAIVTLQENNAFAFVDVTTATVTDIVPLGYKDHMEVGNGFDASNRNDAIQIWQRPTLGMYQPDGLATLEVGGDYFIVSANEGDSRDYDGYSEETRVGDLTLDPDFPDILYRQTDADLGRLKTTTANGDTDGDGDVDEIYSYGARSFSIWNRNGEIIYDSGDQFEKIVAANDPDNFNSTNDENGSGKDRSDDKGVEPEAVEIIDFNGNKYALIGLERQGGIMIFNVNNPTAPYYVNYINNRDFSVEDVTTPEVGDLGIEDILYIDAEQSPSGNALVVTANEISGTVTLFNVLTPNQRFSLQILHNNDGESDLVNAGQGLEEFGGIASFKTKVDSLRYVAYLKGMPSILLSSGDNFLAGPELNASITLDESEDIYDVIGLRAIGYDAFAIGNHEFDFGPDFLARFIEDFDGTTKFLSANLDFTGEQRLQDLVEDNIIAPSTIIYRDNERIGVIGLTTPELRSISSPRNVGINREIATVVQSEVDVLTAQGINKIILISHLQGIAQDTALAPLLSGIDIMIAGGGDELLTNNPDDVIPGSEVGGSYPLEITDLDGETVHVVTTAGGYRYVGQLVVTFDENGKVVRIGEESGPVVVKTDRPDAGILADVVAPVEAYTAALANNILATSEVDLNAVRPDIRIQETNEGNLVADALLWQANQLASAFGANTPNVALQNGGGIRNNSIIPAGDISELTTFEILPFSNFVSIIEPVTAAQFKVIMENAVSQVENVSGRFAQIAGFEMDVDLSGTAQEVDDDGNVLTGGSRIINITLNDGTSIVANGEVVTDAPAINIATIDFLARGGDQYPYGDTEFTTLGVTYQQALANYLVEGLSGLISNENYTAGGEGRIEFLDAPLAPEFGERNLITTPTVSNLYPNPFSNELNLSFEIAKEGMTTIFLSNVQGQVVKLLHRDVHEAGQYQLNVTSLTELQSGVYFLTIQSATGNQTEMITKR